MPGGTYERYGLTGNPFRDLASENLENIELFHVNLELDETLRSIRDEVLAKENKALVAIVGPLGAGKTERLLVTAAEAREEHAFTVYFDVTEKTTWVLRDLSAEFQTAARLAGSASWFSTPKWLRPIAGFQRIKGGRYDPVKAGRAIAEGLNANAPAFLLMNDLHNLTELAEVEAFTKTLQEMADAIEPGVLVMFGAYARFLQWIQAQRPALAARINRVFSLPVLSTEEAGLVLAKKLLAKRVVEDLDPLFPFDKPAVQALNTIASGNPRALLKAADLALEYASSHRAYRVDAGVVALAIRSPGPPVKAPAAQPSGPTAPAPPRVRGAAIADGPASRPPGDLASPTAASR